MTAVKKLAHQNVDVQHVDKQLKQGWNKRILVVDDEPEIVSIYKDILVPQAPQNVVRSSRSANVQLVNEFQNKYDFEVITAKSAKEALMIVDNMKSQGLSFAMGFFDVRLGEGMDGIELVKEIHKSFSDMYAVFVTAYNDRTIDSITKTLGDTRVDRWDYMNKPFNSSEITQKARNFVSLWNLNKDYQVHTELMADLNRKVLEGERVTSVAAVARGVAHEFGNLLMQIMGKAEVSLNKSPEQMKAALEKIIDASQRAHEILDRFNHLSDTKGMKKVKQSAIVDQVVADAVDLMSHQFKNNNIKICYIKREKVTVDLHATSIMQVLVNLFINAIHAMGSPGQIDISILSIDKNVEIHIRDYGPGVPAEILSKITEPFFTTKGDKGTGLGLAISKEIIEIDHGGDFTLQNHSVKGLVAIIKIPLNSREDENEKV
jgi:signal transduction histidine kinase